MQHLEREQDASRRPPRVPPFGTTVDPVEAGRRGGIAAAANRPLRKQRELEAKAAETRNGYTLLKLAEKEQRRNRELERARIDADREVVRLMRFADQERATIAHLSADVADLIAERDKLTAQLESDDGVVAWLRELGEERVTAAATVLGWVETDERDDEA